MGFGNFLGDLTGGLIGESSAEAAADSAKKQSRKATKRAHKYLDSSMGYVEDTFQPYSDRGTTALDTIKDMSAPEAGNLGMYSYDNPYPYLREVNNLSSLYQQQMNARPNLTQDQFNFTTADLQNDPGYQFELQQGNQALDRLSGKNRGLLSGGRITDALNFSQGLASTKLGDAFNRQMRQTAFNNDATAKEIGYNNQLAFDTAGFNNAARQAQTGYNNALQFERAGFNNDLNRNRWMDQFNTSFNTNQANNQAILGNYGMLNNAYDRNFARNQYLAGVGINADTRAADYMYRTGESKGNLELGHAANTTAANMSTVPEAQRFANNFTDVPVYLAGQFLGGGGGGMAGGMMASSKDFKDDQGLVNESILDGLANLDIHRWNYKGEQEGHVGPWAEDFNKLIGKDSKYIDMVDIAGVMLMATKELINEVRSKNGL